MEAVGARGRHGVVLLDCCHSGSGTRAILFDSAERRIPPDDRPRPFSSYLPEAQAAAATRGIGRTSGWQTLGARHVLMAACRDDQTAEEYSPARKRPGAF